MQHSKRKFIRIIGGGIVVAAGAATTGFLTTRTPHRAYEPWSHAGKYSDPRLRALSYAILAPNPHNRQPWMVQLDGDNGVTLRVDTTRLLKETDPFDRQITIGLGCFIELMVQAAANDGYRVEVTEFPHGSDSSFLDDRPIVTAVFEKSAEVKPDPLFAAVLNRRSCKEPFDKHRQVPTTGLHELESVVADATTFTIHTTDNKEDVAFLRDLTFKAFEREYVTPAKFQESIDLMRMGKTEIEASPDGIDIGGPFLESLILMGMMNRKNLADPDSSAFSKGLDMYRDVFSSAKAYVWITSSSNDRSSQIESGRAWVRVNLAATIQGLSLHPISQALQEYPEMKEFHEALHMRLAPQGQTVQMLGRLGYAEPIDPSPRWPLSVKIVNG
ncbi:MAG: hypothetical protein DHS20C01_05700 [marine bacterium B5-7]|nr:MAG: hypothetical protein DHS20C01_05700 [marine bacterium B5-7]